MPRKKTSALRCPTCRKIVLRSEPDFPFCSERCRTIDLGKWASGGYVISTPIANTGEDFEGDYNVKAGRREGPDKKDSASNDERPRKPN